MMFTATTYTGTEAGALALLGMGVGMMVVIAIVYYVLFAIAYWKIFAKAGEPGWKAFIPIYNSYVQFRLTWKTSFFWITLALAIVGGILSAMAGEDAHSVMYIGYGVCMIALAVIEIMGFYWLSRAFGHGGGYTIGFIFFPWLFALILGFGKSNYEGNKSLR